MAAMPGNPARTNSRAIFTLMTQIASWSWPNAGITCGSGLPSNSARCGSSAPSSTTLPGCQAVSSPIWRGNWVSANRIVLSSTAKAALAGSTRVKYGTGSVIANSNDALRFITSEDIFWVIT
jgi:hypothetical protein